MAMKTLLLAEVGEQIANRQDLGLIPLSQVRAFLGCVSPQTTNPQILMVYPQIPKPQISTEYFTILCFRTVLKVTFVTWFYILYKFELEHYICSEKKYVFVNMRSCKSTKKLVCRSQIHKLQFRKSQKKTGSANYKSARCNICKNSAILTYLTYLSPQTCVFSICRTYLQTAHLWLLAMKSVLGVLVRNRSDE